MITSTCLNIIRQLAVPYIAMWSIISCRQFCPLSLLWAESTRLKAEQTNNPKRNYYGLRVFWMFLLWYMKVHEKFVPTTAFSSSFHTARVHRSGKWSVYRHTTVCVCVCVCTSVSTFTTKWHASVGLCQLQSHTCWAALSLSPSIGPWQLTTGGGAEHLATWWLATYRRWSSSASRWPPTSYSASTNCSRSWSRPSRCRRVTTTS